MCWWRCYILLAHLFTCVPEKTSPLSLPFKFFLNNSMKYQPILTIFGTQILKNWYQRNINRPTSPTNLEVQNISQLYSTTVSIFLIISMMFIIINMLTVPLTGLHYIVNVPSDLILLELQQHLFQRRTAFQQCVVDELIEQWRIQTLSFCLCTLNTGWNVG